ncbi:hypothetical protein, partial [Sphingobacterium sp. JUb21]
YCRNRWESRSVPFFIQKPLLYSRGFFVFVPFYAVNRAIPVLPVATAASHAHHLTYSASISSSYRTSIMAASAFMLYIPMLITPLVSESIITY